MTLAQSGALPSVLQSPAEAPTWPPSSPLDKREERRRKRSCQEWAQTERKQRDKTGGVDNTVRGEIRGQRRPRKRRAEGRRWLSLCCVERLVPCKQSICYYWPCKQKEKKKTSESQPCLPRRKVPRDGDCSSGAARPLPPHPPSNPLEHCGFPVGHRHCNLDSVDINCSGCKVSVSLRSLRGFEYMNLLALLGHAGYRGGEKT